MNNKHVTVLASAMLLAISGVAAGGAQAATNIEASRLAIGVGFEPELPLSPASQQNAVRTAKQYRAMSGYSHSGLVNQLEYEGYTPAQAEYGVAAAGL